MLTRAQDDHKSMFKDANSRQKKSLIRLIYEFQLFSDTFPLSYGYHEYLTFHKTYEASPG